MPQVQPSPLGNPRLQHWPCACGSVSGGGYFEGRSGNLEWQVAAGEKQVLLLTDRIGLPVLRTLPLPGSPS
eukprot:9017976-Prorocentrum_lima.AAC.1